MAVNKTSSKVMAVQLLTDSRTPARRSEPVSSAIGAVISVRVGINALLGIFLFSHLLKKD